MCDHLFIVTGGPGAGKTTLIDALARRGVAHMPEAGRAIIRDQRRIAGPALPWADRAAYAEQMLGWEMRSYRQAAGMPGPVLMDRGLPDVIGYLALCGLPVPDHLARAAEVFRYNRRVFVAPYWAEIYARDAERKQDRAEAEATCRIIAETYLRLGYAPVELPFASIEDRADFVLNRIGKCRNGSPAPRPSATVRPGPDG